jgi:hypothetical protein
MNPATIRRNLHRIAASVEVALTRLEYVADNLARNTPDGYPTQASGTATEGGRTTATLTPTEAAANQRLGTLYAIVGDKIQGEYRPGPVTRLEDLNEHLELVVTAMTAVQRELTACGIPPTITQHLQCVEYNGTNCTQWKDKDRTDGRCIDHGREADSNARRKRRHIAGQ